MSESTLIVIFIAMAVLGAVLRWRNRSLLKSMELNERRSLIAKDDLRHIEHRLGIDSTTPRHYRDPLIYIAVTCLVLLVAGWVFAFYLGAGDEESLLLAGMILVFGTLAMPIIFVILHKAVRSKSIYNNLSGREQGKALADLKSWKFKDFDEGLRDIPAFSPFYQRGSRGQGWSVRGELSDGSVITLGCIFAFLPSDYPQHRHAGRGMPYLIPFVIIGQGSPKDIKDLKVVHGNPVVVSLYQEQAPSDLHFPDLRSGPIRGKLGVYTTDSNSSNVVSGRATPDIQEAILGLCRGRVIDIDGGNLIALAPNVSKSQIQEFDREQTSMIAELIDLLAYGLWMREALSGRAGVSPGLPDEHKISGLALSLVN